MDYSLRGKCKALAEKLAREKGYRVVRGFYYEPMWGKEEQHWWCVDDTGKIHDPTKDQFPTRGNPAFYREFDGIVPCEVCGREMTEDTMTMMGRYPVCSCECAKKLVGL